MITYIYLNNEDKNRLQKLAQAKQLSLSACVDIIATSFQWYCETINNYINKGENKIKLSIKSKPLWKVNDKLATNCVYAYFHEESLDFIQNPAGIKNLKRKIQSTMDKTFDPNFLKNIIIRTNYKLQRG